MVLSDETFPKQGKGNARGVPPESSQVKRSTGTTRSTLTVLTEISAVPMLAANAPMRRQQIVDEIGNSGVHHPSVMEQDLAELQLDAVYFQRLAQPAYHSGCRWVSIATNYEKRNFFAQDFMKLMVDLRDIWMEEVMKSDGQSIRLLDTSKQRIPQDRNATPRLGRLGPNFFFQATGSPFPTQPTTEKTPGWSSCVAVGDVKSVNEKGKDVSFGQLGTYAELVFSAQENRRFVRTFYANQSYLVWCTFDRGGAVRGDAVYYHRYPWMLCALVLHFFFYQDDLGLDPSIYYEGGSTFIQTTPSPRLITNAACQELSPCIPNATYVVRRTLFHSTGICGSGSIYWLAQRHEPSEDSRGDDQENWYIIKDTWVVNGCERERKIYDRIHSILTHGTSQGSIPQDILPEGQGIAPLLLTHDVFCDNKLDSVSTNRPLGVNTHPADNLVHTRAVFRATAGTKLLDHFSSAIELLVALRDAVQCHRRLHSHHVLHRNITPYRILVQTDAQEGDRGVLLDFASASMDTSIPRTGEVGCRAFHSRAAAKAISRCLAFTHSYFDDLESFFYVLCYLVTCYPATGSPKPKSIPPSVSAWFKQYGGWEAKSTMILERTFPWSIDDSFQPPVFELLKNLHLFFRVYTLKALNSDVGWRPEPDEAYDGFLGNLNAAINGLRVYEAVANSGPGPTSTNSQVVTPPRHDSTSNEAPSHRRDFDGTNGLHRGSASTTDLITEHSSYMSLAE